MAGPQTAASTKTSESLEEAGPGELNFDGFVADHQDRALRIALRMLSGDRAAAEDVVQEAFVRAHRGLAQFRGDARLSTWFDRILIREAYRHFRRPWRRWLPSEAPESHMQPTRAPDGDPWLRARVEKSLARLSGHQRIVFVLVHMEGHTVSEVAELMGRSTGTVKSHLHRALKSLRVDLADLTIRQDEKNPSTGRDRT